MANPELLEYIRKHLSQGHSEEDLKHHLLRHGWQMNDINEAFNQLRQPAQNVPPPSPQKPPQEQAAPVDKDRKEGSVKGFFKERIIGMLISPAKLFEKEKNTSSSNILKHFVLLAFIGIILLVVSSLLSAFFGIQAVLLISEVPGIGGFFAGLSLIFIFIAFTGGLLLLILGAYIAAVFIHIFVYIVGARGGLQQTEKAVFLGMTPSLLFAWIPYISFILAIWVPILNIIGIKKLHEISWSKAVIAVLLSIIVPLIIVYFVFYPSFVELINGMLPVPLLA